MGYKKINTTSLGFRIGLVFFLLAGLVWIGHKEYSFYISKLSDLFFAQKISQGLFEQTYIIPQLEQDFVPVVKQASGESQHLDVKIAGISAYSYLMYDRKTQTIITGHNHRVARPPASTIKMLTALVASTIYEKDTVFVVPAHFSSSGTKLGLESGKIFSLHALLRALLIFSANDAADILALKHPQSRDGFVEQLNQIASEMGIITNIRTPSGLDADQQELSALDLARIADKLLDFEEMEKIVATEKTLISDIHGSVSYELINTNKLLSIPEITGVKTGTTQKAGQVLVLRYQPANRDIIIVVMGSSDRYQDVLSLMKWERDNVEWISLSKIQ